MKDIFASILREAVEEEINKDKVADQETKEATVEEEPKEEETPEVPEEEEPKEEHESSVKEELKDLIMSILDALEAEMIATGDSLEEDESPDVALEVIYKLIPKLGDEDCQMVYDTLSDYYDISTEEDEEFFEEPSAEENEEDYEEDKTKINPDVKEVPFQQPAE